jgi:hypothetical protein
MDARPKLPTSREASSTRRAHEIGGRESIADGTTGKKFFRCTV